MGGEEPDAERGPAVRLPSQYPTRADTPPVRLRPGSGLGAVPARDRLEGPAASVGGVVRSLWERQNGAQRELEPLWAPSELRPGRDGEPAWHQQFQHAS